MGIPGMRFPPGARLVEAADRQRYGVRPKGAGVDGQRVLLDAGKPDAGDPAGHAGKILGDEGAGESDRLEVVAAPVGRDHRDSHF